MASTKFVEEALRTDVDESTVNEIVGSLETEIVTASVANESQQQQHQHHQQLHQQQASIAIDNNLNNSTNSNSNNNNNNNNNSAIAESNSATCNSTISSSTSTTPTQTQAAAAAAAAPSSPPPPPLPAAAATTTTTSTQKQINSATSDPITNNVLENINSNNNNNNNNNNSISINNNNTNTSSNNNNSSTFNNNKSANPSLAHSETNKFPKPNSSINKSNYESDVSPLPTVAVPPIVKINPNTIGDSSTSHHPNAVVPNSANADLKVDGEQRHFQQQQSQNTNVQNPSFVGLVAANNNNNNSELTVTSTSSTHDPFIVTTTTATKTSIAPSANFNHFNSNHNSPIISHLQQTGGNGSNPITTTISANHLSNSVNMSKNNEPVKLVYPSSVGSSQPAVLNMNNRVTFSQSLPNGTINLATISQPQQNIMQTSTTMATATNTVSAQINQQPQTIVIKNQGANQNIVGNPIMNSNSIQLVNMRPPTPTAQTQQKTVATVSPRVVLSSPHMVAARPTNSGITLTGQPGSALLLKTENGQYRLLHVGPAQGQPAQPTLPNSGANQTIRIQTVPSMQTVTSTSGNTIVVNSSHATSVINSATTSQLPPIASVAPVTHTIAAQQQSHHPQPPAPQPQIHHQTIVTNTQPNVAVNAAPANQNVHNIKEKCRKFLANLLELSSREPRQVAQNVCTLIQELIDATVEPDEFCDRLERLLNASPQPCLIGFLKKSLPLLRQSLCTKELSIEGVKPPPHSVAFGASYSSSIQSQVRPVVPTLATIGGSTQVRMVAQPRPTTITRHPSVRIQGPISVPRLANATVSQIRTPSGATIIQQHPGGMPMHSNPPALHPVSQNAFTAPGGAQIRASGTTIGVRPVTVRQSTPASVKQQNAAAKAAAAAAAASSNAVAAAAAAAAASISATPTAAPIKIGSTQIKPIINAASVAMPTQIVVTSNSTNNSSTMITSTTTPASTTTPTVTTASSAPSKTAPTKVPAASKATASAAAGKDKERKASASFYPQSASVSSSMYGDDDINDVAAMGGVNLAEESQRILGSTELIGRQIRSCKDEVFLHMPALQAKIRSIVAKHGLEEPNSEVAVLISHACQERLKNIVEKLAVIAEHRIDIIKIDPRYEVTKDVRGQIKFLEELDKAEQKRHEEQEREMLMRAAKSRSKTEDPEQAKLKAKAKEMQRAEMEELRQRDANLTALQAIGPRKKPKLESDATASSAIGGSSLGSSGATAAPMRPRIKRVNLRDMVFYLEQERDTCRSSMLYKAYLK